MARGDDWLMGALAAQDAYRGDYPDYTRPSHEPEGPPTEWEAGRRVATGEAPLPTGRAAGTMGSVLGMGNAGMDIADAPRQWGAGAVTALGEHLRSYHTPQDELLGTYIPEERERQSGQLADIAASVPEPTSALGRYAHAIGRAQANPWNYAGMSPGLGLTMATASGIGSELLGHQYKGTPAEPAARFVGGAIPTVVGEVPRLVSAMSGNTVGSFGGKVVIPTHERAPAGAGEAGLDVRPGVGEPPGGSAGLRQAGLEAQRRAGGRAPLPGLPTEEQLVEGAPFIPGPVGSVHDVADRYMAGRSFGAPQPDRFHPLDKAHAAAIAQEYDKLPMYDPAALPAYEAMIRETLAQYQAIKNSGLRITPVDAASYPYGANPRAVAKDIADNNHMAFFKTEPEAGAFGTGGQANIAQSHPLLRQSGEVIGDYPMTNNDLFRVVHDYFGHVKNGYGFRAAGEDNAWRSHAAMYSQLARPAMTSETRGQNSWVNYGPHGDFNRTASGADTIYSPQKVALMPDWTMGELGAPPPSSQLWRDMTNPHAPFPQYAEKYPPVGPPVMKTDKTSGNVFPGKQATPEAKAFEKERNKIIRDMDETGYPPYFDPQARFDVDPANYPLNVDTTQIVPKTLDKMAEHFSKTGAEETRRLLQENYAKGVELGGKGSRLTTQDWYMMGQLENELTDRMGPEAGRASFREKFATPMAATTGGMNPQANLIAAGYMNYLASRGERWPPTHQWPSPVGAQYGAQLAGVAQKIADEGGFSALGEANPKRHNFAGDFMGHRKPGTMDEQMTMLMTQGKKQSPDWYGVNERVAAQEAAKAGVDPRKFQETVWHGFKGYEGPPMISTVNDAIERIHRLTGMPRSEIVYRGWGKGDIPIYGVAGATTMGALAAQDRYQQE